MENGPLARIEHLTEKVEELERSNRILRKKVRMLEKKSSQKDIPSPPPFPPFTFRPPPVNLEYLKDRKRRPSNQNGLFLRNVPAPSAPLHSEEGEELSNTSSRHSQCLKSRSKGPNRRRN